MKRLFEFLFAGFLSMCGVSAWAVSPYISADRVATGDLHAVAADVERKLIPAGFQVLGLYVPRFLPTHGVLVVADSGMLAGLQNIGGAAIVAAPLRIGITTDGVVSYANPDYWYRAFLQQQFSSVEVMARAIQSRLSKALGAGPGFGGEIAAKDLPGYRYIAGMERFGDKSLLAEHADFETALAVVQGNLARETAGVSKVYEIVWPDRKRALFGVAMNSPANGDAVMIGKIGAQNRIAGFPYEVFVLDNEVHALHGRYRLALAFPDLSMRHFLRIAYAPEDIQTTLRTLAGGQ